MPILRTHRTHGERLLGEVPESDRENSREPTEIESRRQHRYTAAMTHNNTDESIKFWIVDSGATAHMSMMKQDFTSIDETFRCQRTAENGILECVGRGTAELRTRDEHGNTRRIQLGDTLLVPDLKYRLYSVSAATRKGVTATFSQKHATLRSRIPTDNLKCEAHTHLANAPPHNIWHGRFGHSATNDIRNMQQHQSVEGMHSDEQPESQMASTIGEKINSDVLGPIPISFNGNKYAISFIDEHSRYRRIYFLNRTEWQKETGEPSPIKHDAC
eukprot:c19421_g1_i4.p2 GENE.c19421_g1_i4~~c19421_g1_i4.p2  ORF type:complete len:273 (-),score=22.84 c19421_g1_i4:1460-2278(-)